MSFLKTLYKITLRNRLITPIIELKPQNIGRYFRYLRDYRKYKSLSKNENIKNLFPVLGEDTATASVDYHYFYQGLWAINKIKNESPAKHVDVGSRLEYIGFLTTLTKTEYIDIRKPEIVLDNFIFTKGDILNMPFENSSVNSLSCLHVAEHIGLGRYGDPLDPNGTKKACTELSRILAKNGNLYFSLPIGKERVQFNAHRIHNPKTIIEYFYDLKLIEFSAIDDTGRFIKNAKIEDFKDSKYSCGLFHFTKE